MVAVTHDKNQPDTPAVIEPSPPPIQPEKDNALLAMATTTTQFPTVASDTKQQNNNSAVYLLDKYAETQDKLLSYIMKYEQTMEQEYRGPILNGILKQYEIGECRFDGNRFSFR